MKLLLTTEELQAAINMALGTQLIVGNRKVSSIEIPNRYTSRTDVVIEFEDEPAEEVPFAAKTPVVEEAAGR